MKARAIQKLDTEFKEIKSTDKKVSAVKSYVLSALKSFCEQDLEFAQAVVQSRKCIEECIQYAVSKSGSSISDLELCQKAAEFYFTGCKVEFKMQIRMSAYEASDTDPTKGKRIELDLEDLI